MAIREGARENSSFFEERKKSKSLDNAIGLFVLDTMESMSGERETSFHPSFAWSVTRLVIVAVQVKVSGLSLISSCWCQASQQWCMLGLVFLFRSSASATSLDRFRSFVDVCAHIWVTNRKWFRVSYHSDAGKRSSTYNLLAYFASLCLLQSTVKSAYRDNDNIARTDMVHITSSSSNKHGGKLFDY